MARYVDGFLLVVAKKKLNAYQKLSAKAGRVWLDHGALEYRECAADDVDVKYGLPFARLLKLKRSETVVFSWIVYKSREQRDRVNELVMKDPRLAMDPALMPFDMKRMSYGGFKTIVDLGA